MLQEENENLASPKNPDDSGKNVDQLRREYEELAQQLPEQDRKPCLEWLKNDRESQDASALSLRVGFLKQSLQAADTQVDIYAKELHARIAKGHVREQTKQERIDWFKGLSFMERARIVKEKDAKLDDLFDPKRAKNLEQFQALAAYFQSDEASRMAFLGKELKDREKEVADLEAKKKVLEEAVLPSIVKNELKKRGPDQKKEEFIGQVSKVQGLHDAQKARFGKLPLAVQEEMRKDFKSKLLPERGAMLDRVEVQIRQYEARYKGQLALLLKENDACLTLFSEASVPKYLDWLGKLSLADMKAMAAHDPDLHKSERGDLVKRMGAALNERIPKNRRDQARAEFNGADLKGRRGVVAKYERETAAAGEGAKESGNFITRMVRKLTFSGSHEQVRERTETFAVASEMAKRRVRFQVAHGVRDEAVSAPEGGKDLTQHGLDQKGLTATQNRTERVEAAMESDRLRDSKDRGKLQMNVLETYGDDRRRLRRALKTDVDDPNAKLAGDIQLKTRSGETVRDAREYERGEVHRELGRAVEALVPELAKAAEAEGVQLTDEQIKKLAEKADWRGIAQEIIRKAA